MRICQNDTLTEIGKSNKLFCAILNDPFPGCFFYLHGSVSLKHIFFYIERLFASTQSPMRPVRYLKYMVVADMWSQTVANLFEMRSGHFGR